MNMIIFQLIVPSRSDLDPGGIWDQKLSNSALTPGLARREKHSFTHLCTTGKKICRLVAAGNFPHCSKSVVG